MKNISRRIDQKDVDSHNYGQVLDQYITDIRDNEHAEKEAKKLQQIEKWHQNSPFDLIFPWHMRLGKYEIKPPSKEILDQAAQEGFEIDPNDFNYTPFKSFNRRRNYLIYTLSHKFDKLWSVEEKEKLIAIE